MSICPDQPQRAYRKLFRRHPIALVALGTGLAVAGCGTSTVGWPAQSRRSAPSIERSDDQTSSKPTTSLVQQASSVNPVLDLDFPDAYVLVADDSYRAFATNSRGLNVPTAASQDLSTWTQVGDALPELPPWAEPGSVWAPSVRQVGDGYVMYVTVGDRRRDQHCIYVATSDVVDGPYTLRDQPIACGPGGSIDASPSTDADGSSWLTWKDEPANGSPARIRSARLTQDGLQVETEPVTLLSSTDVAGHDNIEGPSLARSTAGYIVFFSVGDWTTGTYRTGYATCPSPGGPCQVVSSEWLTTAPDGSGPGGLEAFTGIDGRSYAAYHTWSRSRRVLNIDGLELGAGDTPALVPRSSTPAS